MPEGDTVHKLAGYLGPALQGRQLVAGSEVLFLSACHPETPLEELSDKRIIRIYALVSRLLGRNTRGGPRVTPMANDDAARLWAYGRAGRPCLQCDAIIHSVKLGKALRSTYWCPGCQRAGSSITKTD